MQKLFMFIALSWLLLSCDSHYEESGEQELALSPPQTTEKHKKEDESAFFFEEELPEIEEIVPQQPETESPSQNTLAAEPELKLELESYSHRIFRLRSVEYKITVVNSSNTDIWNVEVKNVIPQQLKYTSSQPQGQFYPGGENGGTVLWHLPHIPPQEMVEINIQLRAMQKGNCRNNVTAIYNGRKSETFADLRIEALPIGFHISTYDTEDPLEVGHLTTYVVEFRNEGEQTLYNIKLIDEVSEELGIISVEGPSFYQIENDNKVVFERYPSLEGGAKLTYRITCRAFIEGSAKNKATFEIDNWHYAIDEEGTSAYK